MENKICNFNIRAIEVKSNKARVSPVTGELLNFDVLLSVEIREPEFDETRIATNYVIHFSSAFLSNSKKEHPWSLEPIATEAAIELSRVDKGLEFFKEMQRAVNKISKEFYYENRTHNTSKS